MKMLLDIIDDLTSFFYMKRFPTDPEIRNVLSRRKRDKLLSPSYTSRLFLTVYAGL